MEFYYQHNQAFLGGRGRGWGNIKDNNLNMGFLPSKILNIEKMLTKLPINKKGY